MRIKIPEPAANLNFLVDTGIFFFSGSNGEMNEFTIFCSRIHTRKERKIDGVMMSII